jgi:cell division septal protein FtsQ
MVQARQVNAKVALFIWALAAFFFFYLSYNYVQVTMHDKQFVDYLQFVVQLAGTENRSAKDIKELLLVKADQLSLPVSNEQIAIKGVGQNLNVIVKYDVDIDFPLTQRQIYTKAFAHDIKFISPH